MYLGKETKVFLKGQAKEIYIKLRDSNNKEDKIIFNSVERVKEILKNNPQYGDPIKKRLIPDEFYELNISNLYRIELSNFWRMLYTLEGDENTIFIFILRIADHKEYNRIFGYRKR